jgi:hypothetical protein
MDKVNIMHISTKKESKFKRIVVSDNVYQKLKKQEEDEKQFVTT